jgi:hypothetical protein
MSPYRKKKGTLVKLRRPSDEYDGALDSSNKFKDLMPVFD